MKFLFIVLMWLIFFTFLKVPDEVNHDEMVIMMLTNVQLLPKEGLFFLLPIINNVTGGWKRDH